MWKVRAKTLIQKAISSGDQRTPWWPVGAALSLLVLAEMDKQQGTASEKHLHQVVKLSSPWNNINAKASCESLKQQQQQQASKGKRPTAELRRFRTLKQMDENSSKDSIDNRYHVDWDVPLGEGSFGAVYLAADKLTGEKVAVKKISKKYTNEDEFYREMAALLHIRSAGGHPGICSLREHFNEGGHYYLILDLVSGGGRHGKGLNCGN